MSRETSQLTIDRIESFSDSAYDLTITSDAFFDNWQMTSYWLQTHVDGCLADCRWAIEDINKAIRYILDRDPSFDYDYILPYWMFHFGGGIIDMSAILKAMDAAEPHQPLLFVAYLEAYYASVWNASFDEQFFAELVRKWSIWG